MEEPPPLHRRDEIYCCDADATKDTHNHDHKGNETKAVWWIQKEDETNHHVMRVITLSRW